MPFGESGLLPRPKNEMGSKDGAVYRWNRRSKVARRATPRSVDCLDGIDLDAHLPHALQFVEQGAAADTESLRRLCAVEIVVLESLQNGLSLDLLESPHVERFSTGGALGSGADAGRKVLRHDHFASAQEGGPFHGIAQLAHIARPGIALE